MYDNEPTMMGQGRPEATLIIRQGPQAGMSFPILKNEILLGREEGLDVILQDPEASRRHTRISWQSGQFVIEDLGSTNGTFVNGVQLTSRQVLSPGDSVGIGQTALVFQVTGGRQSYGPSSYQQSAAPPPPQAPAYTTAPPVTGDGAENKTVQYLLYGCIIVLILCICSFVLAIAAWILVDPVSFEDITGFPVSLQVMENLLKLA